MSQPRLPVFLMCPILDGACGADRWSWSWDGSSGAPRSQSVHEKVVHAQASELSGWK